MFDGATIVLTARPQPKRIGTRRRAGGDMKGQVDIRAVEAAVQRTVVLDYGRLGFRNAFVGRHSWRQVLQPNLDGGFPSAVSADPHRKQHRLTSVEGDGRCQYFHVEIRYGRVDRKPVQVIRAAALRQIANHCEVAAGLVKSVHEIGVEVGRFTAVLLQAVIVRREQLTIRAVDRKHGIHKITKLHGIDFENQPVTRLDFEGEEVRGPSLVQHAADSGGDANRLWLRAAARGCGQILFKIGNQQGERKRRFHSARERSQRVRTRSDRGWRLHADRERIVRGMDHLPLREPVSEHKPLDAVEVQSGDAQFRGRTPARPRRQHAQHVGNCTGDQAVRTRRRAALLTPAYLNEVIAGARCCKSQVWVLVDVEVIVEVQLIAALVEDRQCGVEI